MPRFFDDYSNTYLTHDSAAGRKQQRRGWKFRENFKVSIVDDKIAFTEIVIIILSSCAADDNMILQYSYFFQFAIYFNYTKQINIHMLTFSSFFLHNT